MFPALKHLGCGDHWHRLVSKDATEQRALWSSHSRAWGWGTEDGSLGLCLGPQTMYLELVWLPCSDQLGHQEICVEKVNVLIQEAMEDKQAVRPRRDRGGGKALGDRDSAHGLRVIPLLQCSRQDQRRGKGMSTVVPCPGILAWWNVLEACSHHDHH